MRLRPRLVALSVALVGGLALAEVAGGADDGAAAGVGDDDIDDVPVESYRAESQKAVTAIRDLLQKGLDELKAAREEKDAVRVTCVNGPVVTMKGVQRVGEKAAIEMEDALQSSSTSAARLEFRKLKTSQRRMDTLLRQAQSCAGAVSSASTTSVELAIDDAVTDPYYGNPEFFFDPQDAVANGDTNGLGQQDDITVRPPPASGVS